VRWQKFAGGSGGQVLVGCCESSLPEVPAAGPYAAATVRRPSGKRRPRDQCRPSASTGTQWPGTESGQAARRNIRRVTVVTETTAAVTRAGRWNQPTWRGRPVRQRALRWPRPGRHPAEPLSPNRVTLVTEARAGRWRPRVRRLSWTTRLPGPVLPGLAVSQSDPAEAVAEQQRLDTGGIEARGTDEILFCSDYTTPSSVAFCATVTQVNYSSVGYRGAEARSAGAPRGVRSGEGRRSRSTVWGSGGYAPRKIKKKSTLKSRISGPHKLDTPPKNSLPGCTGEGVDTLIPQTQILVSYMKFLR